MPFDPSLGRSTRKVGLVTVAKMMSKHIGKPTLDKTTNYKDVLKFAWVSVTKCYINYARQRWPEPPHIKNLLAKWNIICVTPLQARYDRKNDRYYIADGQQHAIAWVMMYGPDAEIPVSYIETDDENVESIQLLALNTDSEPMAKYFIHMQKCMMGDKSALALEKAVTNAGCETAYKKRSAGCITHISDLWLAQKDYGLDELEKVLAKMRQYWPTERIFTATMMGFLKVRELMHVHGVYSDTLFEEVVDAASDYFESCERLHLDIKEEFEYQYPTNYKGMGVREKVASGIIAVYNLTHKTKLCPMPFSITMPDPNP